jgi:hypothetical protein
VSLRPGEETKLIPFKTEASDRVDGKGTAPASTKAEQGTEPAAPAGSLLQFRWVASDRDGNAPATELPYAVENGPVLTLKVLNEILLDESSVARACLDYDLLNRRPEIRIELTEGGAQRLQRLTAENINRQLAIISGGKVLSAPIIRAPLPGGDFAIQAALTTTQMNSLIDQLNKALLPASSRTLGPEIDRVLPRPTGNSYTFLDLDSGQLVEQTGSSLRDNPLAGSEISAAPNERTGTGVFLLIVFTAARGGDWNTCTAADILNNCALMNRQAGVRPLTVHPGQDQPDLYFFRTRGEHWGVLQILGDSEQPPGVRIRYRLVQDPAAK